MLVGNSGAASDTVKTTISALTAALTTVLGFYFGAKTASDAMAGGPGQSATTGAATKPDKPSGSTTTEKSDTNPATEQTHTQA